MTKTNSSRLLILIINIIVISYVLQGFPYGSIILPFSLVLWFVQLNNSKTKKELIIQAVILQLIFAYNTMVWIPAPAQTLLQKSPLVSWLFYFSFAPLVTLFIPVYVLLRERLKAFGLKPLYFYVTSALLYYFLDKHFVFLDVSYAYYLQQIPELLSSMKFLGSFSTMIFLIINFEVSARLVEKKRYITAFVPGIVFIILSSSLAFFTKNHDFHSTKMPLILGQSNFSPKTLFEIYEPNKEKRSLIHYRTLKNELDENIDVFKNSLLALPETYFPPFHYFTGDEEVTNFRSQIEDLMRENNISLVAGATFNEGEGRFNIVSFNHEQETEIYKKIFLMPFGEAIPGAQTFPFLYNFFYRPYINSHGQHLKVFSYQGKSFSPIICSEIFNIDLMSKLYKMDMDFIFHFGNESWLLDSSAKDIIYMIAKVRSIESGIPIVKLANTGQSGIIDSDGKELVSLDRNTSSYKKLNISLPKRKSTFYSVNSFYVNLVLDSVSILIILFALFGTRFKSWNKNENIQN